MNEKQLKRYKVISNVIEGNLKPCGAAESLQLSERQIYRLKKGVQKEGVSFLIHKNTNMKPSHTFDDNFKHFQELLLEHESIFISYNALYTLLTSNDITSSKKRRKSKQHHRRKRKTRKGMLIQIDATPFEWFGGKEKFTFNISFT